MNKKILLRKRLKRAALLVLLLMAGLGQSLAQEYHYDWDPSAYVTNMSITGVVQIEGVEQFSTDLEIGAFCGDECRGGGRASDAYFAMLNHYYVFMIIGGDNGDQFTFRLYDHALGEELDLTCSNAVFQINGNLGDPSNPYVFDFIDAPTEITQTTQFAEGWNWWSSYIEMGNNGFAMLQEGLGTNGQMIKSMSNGYASYLSGFGWYGSLTSINNESTYQIRTNAACTVEMTGTAANPEDHPISLTPGWNWIGFPSPYAMSVDEAFSNFTPSNNDMIKAQECFAFYYTGYGWMGTLKTIEPGMGLWYKSNSANSITFAYPTLNEPSSGGENITAATNHWVPNTHTYDSYISIVGVLRLDGEELQDEQYEVGAFDSYGECRGSARPMFYQLGPQNYCLFFLPVWGQMGDQISFKVYDHEAGQEMAAVSFQTITWEYEDLGLPLDDVYVFDFTSVPTYDITVTANPAEGGTVSGSGTYMEGETCTLTATANADEGYHFVNWTVNGVVVSYSNPCTFGVYESADYVANFSNTYDVYVDTDPYGAGIVSGEGTYTYGSECTLTIEANEGYTFVYWMTPYGEEIFDNTYTFTVTEDAYFYAYFEPNTYEITASVNPEGAGRIVLEWFDGEWWGDLWDGSAIEVHHGSDFMVVAQTNWEWYEMGYRFVNWTKDGEVVSEEEESQFWVTESAHYVANFERIVFDITVNAEPEEGGYWWGEGSYERGEECYLTAVANTGYAFENWTENGEVVSTDNPYVFTVTGDRELVAHFVQIFDIYGEIRPYDGGNVTGFDTYSINDTCTLVATPNEGWEFYRWEENGEEVSTDPELSFIVTENRWLTARFKNPNTIDFADPNTETACVAKWDTDGDGFLSYDEAAAVTDLSYAFSGNQSITTFDEMQYFTNLTSIGDYAFNGCYNLTSVVFPEGVTAIGNWAFAQCYGLTDGFAIPTTVTTIGKGAFQYCTGFTSFTFHGGLTYIGGNAFSGCTGLASITFPETLTAIGAEAFCGCSALRGAITLPESLESVGGYAFYGCDEISTVNYNAINCTEVGNADQPAFYDCASLAYINIGENVESIPNYAFKRCSTVEDINSAAVVPPTIGASTFATVSRSIPVSVPYGSGEAYRSAPYWEEFFNIAEDYSSSQYTCHYNVDIHQFEQSMTAVGVIQIDGVEQATDALEIGAFVGDECRGRQLLAYYPQVDRYLVFLTLYGEDGDEFSFRLYDHEAGMESAKGCTSHIIFVANDIIGTLTNPHPFNFVDMQQTQLAAGWNWWSAYVELEGIDGLGMLEESLGTNGEMVKSQSDGYSSYLEGTGWYGSLTAINNESTYLVKVAEDCEVSLEAAFANPADHPVTLSNGWNWMGYPTATAMNLSTALDGFEASDDDLLKAQEGFAMYYTGLGWIGSLRTLMPGMGLMYKSNNGQSVTFTYPTATRQEGTDENITIQANYWATNAKAYPHNMNIVAVVELDGEELQGENYEIAAFANGEVRGSARLLYIEPLNRYLAFLTVAGDEATELHFGLYNAETGTVERQCLASLQYETNAIVGSLTEPYVVSFRGTTGVDEFGSRISMYPNPVASGQTVSINLPADNMGKVTVEVVNALGAVLSSETMSAPSVTIKVPETAGVYMLRISSEDNGICFKKLVVR